MLKRASREAPLSRNRKQMKAAGLHQMLSQLRIDGIGQEMETPDEGQQAGRHAEGDHVGQRIEFPAEVAGGVGHARNAAVERIEGNGDQDGDRRPIKVQLARRALMASMVCVMEKKPSGQVAGGKQRRQQVHAAAQLRPSSGFGLGGIEVSGSRALSSRYGRGPRRQRGCPGRVPWLSGVRAGLRRLGA